MLKRLQYHINVKIKNLLDKMILSTILLIVVALIFCLLFVLTHNTAWLGLLWLSGLIYSVNYFTNTLKFGSIVKDLDQGSLGGSIWLSKAYFSS